MFPAEEFELPERAKPEASDSDSERQRVRLALIEVVAERGYPQTRLGDLLDRADIDAAAFERLYPSLDACFTDLWQEWVEELADRVRAAYDAEGAWRDGMRAMAWELYRFLAEDRRRARICAVEINFGGELAHATRDQFMDTFVDLIHRGRFEGERKEDLSRARAEAIFGATWEQVAVPISNGGFDDLIDVVPQVLYLLFLPYLGPGAARDELNRGREEVARLKRAG